MLKKIFLSIVVLAVFLAGIYYIGTGFQKASNEILVDYSVSEDGTELTFRVSTWESIGYVRGYKDKGGGIKPHYLTFYRAFGGINGKWGAKNTFTLELSPDATEIYFNRSGGGYELVLEKNPETGEWKWPEKIKEKE